MEKLDILIIRKNPNTISMEIENNNTGKTIEKLLIPITNLIVTDIDRFMKAPMKFFNKYYKDCLITFFNEKKSIDLFIKILEHMDEDIVEGIVVQKEKSFYVRISDKLDSSSTYLSKNISTTHNLLNYFKALYEDFDNKYIIKPQ